MTSALLAFALVALFMAVMALVYTRGGDGRTKKTCGLEPGSSGPCAWCGAARRNNCEDPK
ncbi:MAG TPA: hypothetical protein PK875_01995 [Spirochaetota bacterium]|nr:MAG: hypothetical protein BWY96_01441 [Spirochaetes bacterium ADurb.BinA120]HPO44546.1 hypothetical protein [Spirochaetota bacterium]